MADFKLPYGAEFSPDKIKIKEVLKMASSHEGQPSDELVTDLAKKYYKKNHAMASNCKNSMVAYEILETGGGVTLSAFGNELLTMTKEAEIYDAMAKRILTHLSGLMFIEAIRTISQGGNRPTLESMTEKLNLMGCEELSKTNKHVATMKKWLEKAKVLNGWEIKEKKLESLIGVKEADIKVLRGLTREQACFIKALCNTGSDDYQNASKIRDLATASYNVDFPAKNFANAIIKPLEDKKLIEKKPSASSHGGNSSEIKLESTVKAEVLASVLEQIEIIAGKEVLQYCQKSLEDLRTEIDSTDTHVKGLALEAFAIKMMRIINLDFIGTRVKGSETGGAEVDVLFDTTRLNYSRWQVQCKNTPKVSIDQVAKEVGLSHVLKTNVIVILTTGKATSTAKEYATTIMREMNLCIIFIEADDIDEILSSPASIVDVLNRESQKAKQIKILDGIEEK
ncbi:MAG: restriction endonuclease [Clostridium sp.]|uniref:restriction endonuclease n=1 Tax=Blautia obeum TaxID=40520 RepID=UPI000334DB66|nr:putative uncharacterized protein [Clostridium sp. CAG:7]